MPTDLVPERNARISDKRAVYVHYDTNLIRLGSEKRIHGTIPTIPKPIKQPHFVAQFEVVCFLLCFWHGGYVSFSHFLMNSIAK